MDHRSQETSVGDRRRGERRAIRSKVRVVLAPQELDGDADNVSRSGILFFTDGELRVEVEYDERGTTRRTQGTLVRCERIRGNHRGWAVEFDPE